MWIVLIIFGVIAAPFLAAATVHVLGAGVCSIFRLQGEGPENQVGEFATDAFLLTIIAEFIGLLALGVIYG